MLNREEFRSCVVIARVIKIEIKQIDPEYYHGSSVNQTRAVLSVVIASRVVCLDATSYTTCGNVDKSLSSMSFRFMVLCLDHENLSQRLGVHKGLSLLRNKS